MDSLSFHNKSYRWTARGLENVRSRLQRPLLVECSKTRIHSPESTGKKKAKHLKDSCILTGASTIHCHPIYPRGLGESCFFKRKFWAALWYLLFILLKSPFHASYATSAFLPECCLSLRLKQSQTLLFHFRLHSRCERETYSRQISDRQTGKDQTP